MKKEKKKEIQVTEWIKIMGVPVIAYKPKDAHPNIGAQWKTFQCGRVVVWSQGWEQEGLQVQRQSQRKHKEQQYGGVPCGVQFKQHHDTKRKNPDNTVL